MLTRQIITKAGDKVIECFVICPTQHIHFKYYTAGFLKEENFHKFHKSIAIRENFTFEMFIYH